MLVRLNIRQKVWLFIFRSNCRLNRKYWYDLSKFVQLWKYEMFINVTSYSPGRSSGIASCVSYWLGLFLGLPFTLLGSNTWNSSHSDDIVLVCFRYPRGVFFWQTFPPNKNFLCSVRWSTNQQVFSIRYWLSEISCSSSWYQLPFTSSSL